jgi:hypothetical protein
MPLAELITTQNGSRESATRVTTARRPAVNVWLSCPSAASDALADHLPDAEMML